MKAFSEKSDLILRTLKTAPALSWDMFTQLCQINRYDAVLVFLKNTGLIEYSDTVVMLTDKGSEFINTTSFVEQRDREQHS
jgi:hypothetical protein